ncbi:MAG: nucleotidyltransferase domain-containing protein [Nanoarchaeota archaeon]
MLQEYDIFKNLSKWKVLQPFFADPHKNNIGLRELSRTIGLSTPSVKLHLKQLVKEGVLKNGIFRRMPVYCANQNDERFRELKKINNINLLHKTGFIQHIFNKCQPNVMILFGSASRGEDTEESDIDLYLECAEQQLDLSLFEKELKRKIQLHFYDSINRVNSKELKNNLLNGIILEGYIKVF